MKILAIDYGERRTGLAVSDDLGITAQGLDTLVVKDEGELPGLITETVRKLKVERILLGLPRNMNGSEGEQCAKVREFGDALGHDTEIPVVYWDERMTSLQAQRVMLELGTGTRGNKHAVDRIAATLMLQEYLSSLP